MKGRPWYRKAAGDDEEVHEQVRINVPERSQQEVPPIPEMEADEPGIRRYKIDKDLIKTYGHTPKCYGCRAIRLELSRSHIRKSAGKELQKR